MEPHVTFSAQASRSSRVKLIPEPLKTLLLEPTSPAPYNEGANDNRLLSLLAKTFRRDSYLSVLSLRIPCNEPSSLPIRDSYTTDTSMSSTWVGVITVISVLKFV